MRFWLIVAISIIVLAGVVLFPQIDLIVSGWFYRPGEGFFFSNLPLFDAVHVVAHAGARLLGLAFFLLMVVAAVQRRPVAGLDAKGWAFLLIGLLLGPGLIANGVFKDHWGRARPREVTEFGGASHFTPAFTIANQCDRNCSFVSGDGSFGFFLPIFAYIVPLPRSRHSFWSGIGTGCVFAFVRVAVGAHFLSDSLYALFFTQAILAGLHGLMFGWDRTRKYWRLWLFFPLKPKT